ncbi:MAG: SPOR domain-containing protein [Cyanobacteria bacterium P01_G01_bin.54]
MRSSSPHNTTHHPGLPPILEVALGSLDIQLEAELARYRRHRLHQHVAPTPTAPPSPSTATEPHRGHNNDVVNLTQSTTAMERDSASQAARQNPSQDPPQDYLQSSEQLLKTLDKTPPSTQTTAKRPHLTGWYVGTAALLMIAAALVGISWQRSRLQLAQQTPSATEVEIPTSSSAPPTDIAEREPLDIDGPNLAVPPGEAEPTDAPPAPPANATTPQPQASPANRPPLTNQKPNLVTALLPESPQLQSPTATQAPDSQSLDNAAPTPNPANVAAPPPANDRLYYVLMDYTADTDLTRARLAVQDAYPRQFSHGLKIQMAAFDNSADAQDLVNRLQAQGIVAKVHQPAQ